MAREAAGDDISDWKWRMWKCGKGCELMGIDENGRGTVANVGRS